MPKDTICQCGKMFDRDKIGHYFINGVYYCLQCGLAANEERKGELQADMCGELLFGEEM